jgi:hypothetical protein
MLPVSLFGIGNNRVERLGLAAGPCSVMSRIRFA